MLYREHRKKSQRPTWRFLSKSKPPVTPLPSAPPKEKRKVEAFRTPFLPVESETSVENETPSRLGYSCSASDVASSNIKWCLDNLYDANSYDLAY